MSNRLNERAAASVAVVISGDVNATIVAPLPLPVSTTQLPAALVGGRLDVNLGAWLGSTAPTVGSKTMANSIPVVIASDQTQFPAALVGGRFDINNGAWLGSTAPTVGQKASASSIPVVLASDQTVISTRPPASTVATKTSVAGTVSADTTILAANANRRGMTVFNDSSAILYLSMGATATTTNYTVQLGPSAYWEMPPDWNYTGIITGVWASATGNARVTEISP